jgi:hypothetical protein
MKSRVQKVILVLGGIVLHEVTRAVENKMYHAKLPCLVHKLSWFRSNDK